MNQRNLVVGVVIVAVVAVATIVGARYFKKEEKTEQPEALVMPSLPPTNAPGSTTLRRPGPEPSLEAQRRCMEKYPKDAFARHACEDGVIGISDEELKRKLNEAWNSGLRTKR